MIFGDTCGNAFSNIDCTLKPAEKQELKAIETFIQSCETFFEDTLEDTENSRILCKSPRKPKESQTTNTTTSATSPQMRHFSTKKSPKKLIDISQDTVKEDERMILRSSPRKQYCENSTNKNLKRKESPSKAKDIRGSGWGVLLFAIH